MSRFIRTGVLVSGIVGVLTLGLGMGTAHAQIMGPITFTTTFPFTVGNTHVPAGHYEIRPADPQASDLVLELASPSNRVAVMFLTTRTTHTTPAASTDVTFNRYGDRYFLRSIEVEGEDDGVEAAFTRVESREARQHGAPTEHRVAAVRTPIGTKMM